MASVTISQYWPDDGGMTSVEIEFEDSYPDALSRACDEAMRSWLAATGADSDDEI